MRRSRQPRWRVRVAGDTDTARLESCEFEGIKGIVWLQAGLIVMLLAWEALDDGATGSCSRQRGNCRSTLSPISNATSLRAFLHVSSRRDGRNRLRVVVEQHRNRRR